MSTLKKFLVLIFLAIYLYFLYSYFKILLYFGLALLPIGLYFLFKMRYNLVYIPFYLIAKIQGKNFRLVTSLKDIKYAMQLTDKGRGVEDLFSCPAWSPIISLESVNGALWEEVRKNFLILKKYLPSKDKLGEIVKEEFAKLFSDKIVVDSKIISITTVKIFLKWIFCENNAVLEEKLSEDPSRVIKQSKTDFSFINNYIKNSNLLLELYEASLEYRKEIAVKGPGCLLKKQNAIDLVVNILKNSNYKDLFNWDEAVCYSIIMQPFIISPMINISDIAVSIKKYSDKIGNFSNFSDFVDFCIFNEHPFPVFERFEAKTNTQFFIDLAAVKSLNEFDGTILNFGMGIRSCLGRLYAKEFLNCFFEPIYSSSEGKVIFDKELFQPNKDHLYSGRDNDNFYIWEGLFQVKVILKILTNEILENL